MSWVKKTGVSIFTIILLITLILSGVLLTLTLSLRYNQVHDPLKDLAKTQLSEQVTQEEIDQYYFFILESCKNQTEYYFNEQGSGLELRLPCDEIKVAGSEGFLDLASEHIIKDIYNREYTCTLTTCMSSSESTDRAFYVSKQAQRIAIKYYIISIIIALVMILFIFFLAETRASWAMIVGTTLIISSFAFFNFGIILSSILNTFVSVGDSTILQSLTFISNNARTVFYTHLGIGIILVILE